MQKLPFNIPKSLLSYIEKFDEDPEKVTKKLRKHLKKRGPDAVGHFLLAWFLHLQNKNGLAIREALKARTYAPGSPLMEHLHYYLVHPEKFDAAIPGRSYSSNNNKLEHAHRNSPVLDIDRLISLLEAVESQRIRMPEDGEKSDDTDLSKLSENIDDVVSETLASIHAKQGRTNEAISMYEKLKVKNADKADHYDDIITDLKSSSKT